MDACKRLRAEIALWRYACGYDGAKSDYEEILKDDVAKSHLENLRRGSPVSFVCSKCKATIHSGKEDDLTHLGVCSRRNWKNKTEYTRCGGNLIGRTEPFLKLAMDDAKKDKIAKNAQDWDEVSGFLSRGSLSPIPEESADSFENALIATGLSYQEIEKIKDEAKAAQDEYENDQEGNAPAPGAQAPHKAKERRDYLKQQMFPDPAPPARSQEEEVRSAMNLSSQDIKKFMNDARAAHDEYKNDQGTNAAPHKNAQPVEADVGGHKAPRPLSYNPGCDWKSYNMEDPYNWNPAQYSQQPPLYAQSQQQHIGKQQKYMYNGMYHGPGYHSAPVA